MRWILLATLTAVVLAALKPVRRRNRPRPRTATRPAGRAPRRAPVILRIHRLGGRRRKGEPNPFEALRVQTRLGIVADEVRMLERDQNVYARAHHLEATQTAYDALLAEACILAGVATDPQAARGDEQERFREEVELTSRGWSW